MRRLMQFMAGCGLILLLSPAAQSAGDGIAVENDLVVAAMEGDIDRVNSLLKAKADLNAAQADGTTALAWAVYNDDEDMVDLLIRAGGDGADVNAANDYGVVPLHLACMNQNPSMVGKLLKAGADPNRAKLTGETPLMTCANTGSVEAAGELLDYGADVNASENREDQTALMWAAAEKHPEVVKLLVERGADVHARSRLIKKPDPFVIDAPTWLGRNYPSALRFRETEGDFTALLFAAQQGDLESVKILLDAGADINYATKEEGSALVIASAAGHEDLAIYLLEHGADPDIADGWGIAPIHYTEFMGILMLNNWHPRPTDKEGWLRESMPRLLKSLLAHGANPNARIKHTWSFLDNPYVARGTDEVSQIDMAGATPLLLAATAGDIESMKILIANGADRNATTIGGATLFMLAAGAGVEKGTRDEHNAIEAARYVLSLGGVDVNAQLTNDEAVIGPGAGKIDGRCIMHFAVTLGWEDMIRFLAAQGVDLDHGDRYGMTPLMLAMGDPEARYYRNIPIGRYDDRYRRPRPNKKIEKLLLDLGAKPFTGKVVNKGSVD